MTDHNMRHMEFLELVAASDVAVLRKKEATYQGSWKAAGGRSAWFMARRNIDRLLNMMKKPPAPYDWSMEDLDDLLDTNVLVTEATDVTLDHSILKYLRDAYVSENIFHKIRERPLGSDGTVLAVCRDLRRYLMLVEAEMISRGVVSAEQGEVRQGQGTTFFGEVVEVDVTQFISPLSPPISQPTTAAPTVAQSDPLGWFTPKSAAATLALQPWLVDAAWIHAHGSAKHNAQAVDTYYKRQALNLWVLEPAVRDLAPPSPIDHLYIHKGSWYILGIHHCPPEARDYFPVLEREVNTVTRDQLPEWQRPMYHWSESETKWRIYTPYEAWTVRD